MRIDILTVQPKLLDGPFDHSILKRAIQRGIAQVHIHDLRVFGLGKHKQVDDYAYGGGAGMVMRLEPMIACIEALQSERKYDAIIYMTPDGERFNQSLANQISLQENIILLCGHYKGIDHRLREHIITREISIGDYVLSGGELAAAVVTDAVLRLLPGAMNDETSALSDSFQDNLLAPPVYTRPSEFRGWKVPEILIGGDTRAVEEWRHSQSVERTKKLRPDLLEP